MLRGLGVHGVGNLHSGLDTEAAADHLARIWRAALDRSTGPVDLDLNLAYYADLVASPAQGVSAESLDEASQRLVADWATTLGAPADVSQGVTTVPIRQILTWISERFGLEYRLVDWFVAIAFREIGAYFATAETREECRRRVIDAIAEHRPEIVVAHSLGSVVTFEALCLCPDVTVNRLITIGSPLGLPHVIYDRLESGATPTRRRPPGVRQWINIADIGDIVAVPVALGGRFDVDADHDVNIGLFDFHRVTRYLASRLVGSAITGTSR